MKKIKKIILILKLFLKVTPVKLYIKVIKNFIKNYFGLLTPSSCVFGITYKCQLNCPHCSAGTYSKTSKELNTEEIKEILIDIHKIGVPRLNVSGGEALLRKDIYEIIYFASKYFVTVLESNGVIENEEIIKGLKKSGLCCLSISMDCPDSNHELIRGNKGLFKNIIKTLELSKKYKLTTILSTYITKKKLNIDFFNKFKDIAKTYKPAAIRVMPVRPVGNSLKNFSENDILTEQDEKWIFNNAEPSVFYFKGLPAPSVCGIFLKNTFYISPYAEVQPCAYLPLSFGNLKNEKLKDILERMWEHKIFKEAETHNCLIIDRKFREKYIKNALKFPVDII